MGDAKPASSDNLFAAAKGYALAMSVLVPAIPTGQISPLTVPFHFLGAFSLELSFKAVVASSSTP